VIHVGESCAFADGPAVWPITLGQRRRAEALGWRFTSLDAALSPQRQRAQVARLIDLGIDALTTWTLDAALMEPAYARAAAAGIPVIAFNAGSPSVTTVIRQHADSPVPAADAAGYIAARVPEAGVLVVGGPPIPALAERTAHFLAAARERGLRILAREDNLGDVEETARPIVERLIERHPEADAIWCFNDHSAVAAGKALVERGMPICSGARRGVIVSGIGGTPNAIEGIRAGTLTFTYDSLPVDAGRAAIDVLERLLVQGDAPPGEIWIECRRYDASNLGSFIPWDQR
jgi:ribose transport system substrate-binding protein